MNESVMLDGIQHRDLLSEPDVSIPNCYVSGSECIHWKGGAWKRLGTTFFRSQAY